MSKKIFDCLLFCLQLVFVTVLSLFSTEIKEGILSHGEEYEFPVNYIYYNAIYEDSENFNPDKYYCEFTFTVPDLSDFGEFKSSTDDIYISIEKANESETRRGYCTINIDDGLVQKMQPLFQNSYWIHESEAVHDNSFKLTGIGECKMTVKVKISGSMIKYEGLYADGIEIEDYFK